MYIMTEIGWQPLYRPCVNENDLQGVYRPDTVEDAQVETSARTDKFCDALEKWIEGYDFGTSNAQLRWPAMWRYAEGHRPMFGSFGERL